MDFSRKVKHEKREPLFGDSLLWGEQDSNLRRLCQQIYSLPRLTASVSPRYFFEPNLRFELRTPRLQITCSGQLS